MESMGLKGMIGGLQDLKIMRITGVKRVLAGR